MILFDQGAVDQGCRWLMSTMDLDSEKRLRSEENYVVMMMTIMVDSMKWYIIYLQTFFLSAHCWVRRIPCIYIIMVFCNSQWSHSISENPPFSNIPREQAEVGRCELFRSWRAVRWWVHGFDFLGWLPSRPFFRTCAWYFLSKTTKVFSQGLAQVRYDSWCWYISNGNNHPPLEAYWNCLASENTHSNNCCFYDGI